MGKGDIKTKKGKIAKGTFGVRRPRKSAPSYVPSAKPKAKVAAKSVSKKEKAKKGD